MKSGADFSDDKTRRYKLWRIWDESKPILTFCMLNPSTADEVDNDPTIERCKRRAELWGYGGIIVVNIFSLRSTDPKGLYGRLNLEPFAHYHAILEAAEQSKMFICGWGKHGKLNGRGDKILRILKDHDIDAYALKINKDGSPAHPLYIGYNVEPIPLEIK